MKPPLDAYSAEIKDGFLEEYQETSSTDTRYISIQRSTRKQERSQTNAETRGIQA